MILGTMETDGSDCKFVSNDDSPSSSGASRSQCCKSEPWGLPHSLLKGGPKWQQMQSYRRTEWKKIWQEGNMQSWEEWKERGDAEV